jgi:hypothetical protein
MKTRKQKTSPKKNPKKITDLSKKNVQSSPPPPTPSPSEPIKENKSIGIENINVILESLEKISVQDILTANENPDITTMSNNILAIS